jgi:hypothetical protein
MYIAGFVREFKDFPVLPGVLSEERSRAVARGTEKPNGLRRREAATPKCGVVIALGSGWAKRENG